MKFTEKIKQRQQPFQITSICRDDLEEVGFDTKNVDDGTMLKLASKMADAYCEDGFWIDLEILADHLKIKQHKK
ncbi:MAG: hypothetical protein WC839_01555 [Candidatus Paceibacterota bacterium]